MIDVAESRRYESKSRPARRASASDDVAASSLKHAASSAQRHIKALTGKPAVSVTSVDPTENGWRIDVEVLEEERIPASLDVLALYEVELDRAARLVAYRRTRRYSRTSSLDGSK